MDKKIELAADAVADALDADVLFLTGAIEQRAWHSLVRALKDRTTKRKHVLLVLVTPGGDPDSAFKIGRYLQNTYDNRVITFVPGWCKSAGTLITLASRRIIIGDLGELGPLDIQVAKSDELFEMSSGLSVQSAFTTLQQTASKMFIDLLFSIRGDTGRGITTRTAAELAASIVGSLLEPIYKQIEPVRIGENQRAMSITKGYGARLAKKSGILRSARVLDFLVGSYPDHGFVIDREEAGDLFTLVEKPGAELERLADVMGDTALRPKDGSSEVRFLSNVYVKPKRQKKLAKGPSDVRSSTKPRASRPDQSAGDALGASRKRTSGAIRNRSRNGVAVNGSAREK